MSCICVCLLPVLGLLIFLYIWGRWKEGHFSRHGVKSIPQKYPPILQNILLTILRKIHFMDPGLEAYRRFPDQKYVGVMQLQVPLILIRDLDLIKQLAVKDFDNFHDHMITYDENTDPMFGKSLLGLQGQKWRDMRATLSPAFTSSKMKNMFSLVVDCAQQMADYYLQQLNNKQQLNKDGVLEVELKDSYTRCANDVIASAAFGIQTDSLTDKDNEFFRMGGKLSTFTPTLFFKFMIFMIVPKLAKLLDLKIVSGEAVGFFRRMVEDTMRDREERGIHRPDMIQLLMEAKKGSLKHEGTAPDKADAGFATVEESHIGKETVKREWSDDEITAQAFVFFLAGFDSASSVLSCMSYELAVHPEVQQRLQEEIDQVLSKSSGHLDYTVLQSMKYMDMVVSETLRMWPPAMQTDRKCLRPCTLPPAEDSSTNSYHMKAGDAILIPIYAIHHDPQYFPEPQRFDPERFSDDNKDKINRFSYMPFGVGPRSCIGSRFALMEVKAVIFHMLSKFDFLVTSRTQIPLKLKKGSPNVTAEDGFWIGLKLRDSKKDN